MEVFKKRYKKEAGQNDVDRSKGYSNEKSEASPAKSEEGVGGRRGKTETGRKE